MFRRWYVPALLVSPALICLGATPAAASIQCNISIVMSTLGTDGTTTVTEIVSSPAGTTVTSSGTIMSTDPMGVPSGATSNPTSETGSGTGSGTTSGGTTTALDPVDSVIPPDASVEDGPVAPTPPVLTPTVEVPTTETPIVENVISVPTSTPVDTTEATPADTDVSETPEPGTLTLLALGMAGGVGYFRKKKTKV